MSATLTARAQTMLDNMPPYEADDDFIQSLMRTVGLELERIDDYLADVRSKLRPQNSDDSLGMLSLYERLSGLPVAPEVSVDARQRRVLAAIARGRSLGIGEGWADLINLLLNTTAWTEDENDPEAYELKVTVPFPGDSYQAGGLQELLSRITPAHIHIDIVYSDAFLVGIGEVGEPL